MFCYPVDDDISLALVHGHDAKEVVQLVGRQKDYLGQYLPWVNACDEQSYEAFVEFALNKYAEGKGVDTSIVHQGKIIGAVSLNNIYPSLKKADIGYWLDQEHQGRGIMTRAVRGLMEMAKNYYGVQVLEIRAAEHNLPSRRVAERLGFDFCGILANNVCVNGKIFNHAVYVYRFDD